MDDTTNTHSAARRGLTRAAWVLIAVAVGLGLAARLWAIAVAPQTAYLYDHLSNMGWGTYAVEHGPWRMYDLPAGQPLVVRKQAQRSGEFRNTIGFNAHACNYPPLSVYFFWIQGLIWHGLDSEIVTLQPPVSSRVIDTRVSRLADAFPGIVFDFFLAWGVMCLVRQLHGTRRSPILESIAFSITILAPPIFLDSAFWNQADSWIACMLVWTLVHLMRGRLILSGVLFGLALVTKPQAVLFGPVLVYVFFSLRFMNGGTWRRALELWKPAVVAVLVALFIATPFMIADAGRDSNPDGAWRWFKRSYIGTLGAESYQRTTLNAFNFWWLDKLSQGMPPTELSRQREFFQKSESPNKKLLGLRKGTLGKLMLGLSIVGAWLLCGRKWRWERVSWPVCGFLVMLAAFALPISVHERYVYYCIPFLIALACWEKKWIVPLLALLAVGTFEMTSYRWVSPPKLYGPDDWARTFSALLAVLTVLSLVYSYLVLFPRALVDDGGGKGGIR